ncbi:LysM domain-containing protein [Strongyloides ratti]|uniref:LysM domain-containing protein n=1 Tax=Strongyloides ratti TaxID=34506 RepID=A0A090KXQ2_STRRB|nr:LysM domain-containing protein [Strongyloides ratti]CEF62275.1 LysM domain-containing protein [Strongyloides ratti]
MAVSPFENTTEYTFLFSSSQRYRRYGSCSDLNSHTNEYNMRKVKRISMIEHEIKANETLQSICLKYECNVSEVKRINKLWNNEDLFTRKSIKIPIYLNKNSNYKFEVIKDNENECDKYLYNTSSNKKQKKEDNIVSNIGTSSSRIPSSAESIKDFLNRIDRTTKKSIKAVKNFEKKKNEVIDIIENIS